MPRSARWRPTVAAYLQSLACDAIHYLHDSDWPAESIAAAFNDGRFRVKLTVEPGQPSDVYPSLPIVTLAPSGALVPVKRPATINERLLAAIEADASRLEWSARRWAKEFQCSAPAVTKTPAWKRIQAARALHQADRANRGSANR